MWVEILILGHLGSEPAHGYEIKQKVGRSIGYTHRLNNNVLYPALRRLEEMRAIEGEVVPQEGSPPRRVYRLTEQGVDVLRGMLEEFPPEWALNDGEFNTRLGYFELMDPRARLHVLRTRAAAVQGLLDHLRRSLVEMTDSGTHPYARRLVEFLIAQREAEADFLEQLAG